MKILWLSNILFPEVCEQLKMTIPASGGWMYSSAKALIDLNGTLELAVVSNYDGKDMKLIIGEKIKYYLIPSKNNQIYDRVIEKYYRYIVEDYKPDLVHIHGTEFPNSLAFVKANGAVNVVVSIQGLTSVISDYYLAGINHRSVNLTLRDILLNDSMFSQKEKFAKKGKYERELIYLTNYHIGRTNWDKSNLWEINPTAQYFYCNETLREGFYKDKWTIDNCIKHTIFISQAFYPIKGLHMLIKALPIILHHYPNTKVYVAGNDFLNVSWYRKNGYANFIEKLLLKNNLKDKVEFLGLLNENEMVQQYKMANVFVCPSSIENSPNSVGEAQLIGTPCVASYVGGTMDMITDGETGFLYRFEETVLLARRICEIFENDALATRLSDNGRKLAAVRHNRKTNAIRLYEIYKEVEQRIMSQDKSDIYL